MAYVEIRQNDKGEGVYATCPFQRGESVIVGRKVRQCPRDTSTLQFGPNEHWRLDVPFEKVNHSCEPNCGVELNEHNAYTLVALGPIATGDEITFDYAMTEWDSISKFVGGCKCGKTCRALDGCVGGAVVLPDVQRQLYAGYIAPHVLTSWGSRPSPATCIDEAVPWGEVPASTTI